MKAISGGEFSNKYNTLQNFLSCLEQKVEDCENKGINRGKLLIKFKESDHGTITFQLFISGEMDKNEIHR